MRIYPHTIISLIILVVVALGAQATVPPQQTVQFRVGRLLPTDSIHIYMEYPEYEPLSREEIKALKEGGVAYPDDKVHYHISSTLSRGETLIEASFLPIVQRNGQWQKIVRYELKYRLVGSTTSPVVRSAVKRMQQLTAASRYASHSVLATGKWVKIRVGAEGIYQLTDSELSKMGFSDPARVKLYGYGGRLIEEKFSFDGAHGLIDDLNEVPLYRRKGSVLFFAEGLTRWSATRFSPNTYSSYSYYFLTEGDAPASFPSLSAPSATGQTIDRVQAYALADKDEYTWYGGGRDFYFNSDTRGGHTVQLSLPGHVGGARTVYYDVSAQSSVGTTSVSVVQAPDAAASDPVSVTANITKVGEGETARGYRGSFTAVLDENAKFTITTSNTGHLNYLYCPYIQYLSTAYTTASFTADTYGIVNLSVADANTNTRVWQLGSAISTVSELPGVLQGSTYTARAADGTARFVLVNISKDYPSPEVVGEIPNQDLHADGSYDYVIIVPASGTLTSEAERLAEAHRSRRGVRVKVVRADQLYNEFSSGTPDASAYRRYLKMLYDRATAEADMPRYLLLFGDCVYDNRMLTAAWRKYSPDDYLLAYERNDQENYMNSGYAIGTLHSYVTDDYYGFLDDGEGSDIRREKIDLGIGRFVCHTEEKAKWLVDRAIDYMDNKHVGSWKNKMWAVADVGDNNLHMEDAQYVSEQLDKSAPEALLLRRVFPDAYASTQEARGITYPAATAKLKTAMQQGALILNYNGHGSPDRLSHYFLLDKEDLTANVSTSRPLWMFASCEITPYDQDVTDIGRNALFAPNAPAVAVVCAARSVYANYNRSLNAGMIKYAFSKSAGGERYTLGDALRLTKEELLSGTTSNIGTDATINKLKYVLMGDPALALQYPDPGITVDSINGIPVTPDANVALPIGSVARFSGYVNADTSAVAPDITFTGTLTGTILSPLESIVCKGYGSNNALTYKDYNKTLFEGAVNVEKGRFTISFVVPRGIKMSASQALLSLYAVSSDAKREYNGHYGGFCLNGSSASEQADTLGPDIYLYLDTPDFPNGGEVSASPTFYASLSDSSGISMISGTMGHDMELWMDGDANSLVTLNDYFTFDYGSYSKGLVEYPLSSLSPGRHKLSFRAWDVYDNPTTATLDFIVSDNPSSGFDVLASRESASSRATRFITSLPSVTEFPVDVTTEIYDITGVRVWHTTATISSGARYTACDWDGTDYGGVHLSPGVYLYRSLKGNEKTSTKKLLIP